MFAPAVKQGQCGLVCVIIFKSEFVILAVGDTFELTDYSFGNFYHFLILKVRKDIKNIIDSVLTVFSLDNTDKINLSYGKLR